MLLRLWVALVVVWQRWKQGFGRQVGADIEVWETKKASCWLPTATCRKRLLVDVKVCRVRFEVRQLEFVAEAAGPVAAKAEWAAWPCGEEERHRIAEKS